MKEVLRTNDMVTLSWAQALLTDAGIEHHVFDQYTSAIEGSILAIQRRILVLDEDRERAARLLREAGIDAGTG